MTPMQKYNANRYLLNHLSIQAYLAIAEFRECYQGKPTRYKAYIGNIDVLAKRLMKLARLQCKISGQILFITASAEMTDPDSVLP